MYDGTLVTPDEPAVDAEVVRDAGAEAGPDVAVEKPDDPGPEADPDDTGPEADAIVPELSKAARLAETSELIDATSALSRFAVKKSGSPSVCNGGKEKETDELADELEDELEPEDDEAEVAEELVDEPEAEVAVDESSFEEDLLSLSSSSSSDNCWRPSKSASIASKSGVVPGGTSILDDRSLAILIAQPARPSTSPARFSMPLNSERFFNLNPEPPPQASTFGGRSPPRFVKAATALILIWLLSFRACVLIAGMVIEPPQALPWLAKLAITPPNMNAWDVAAGPEVPIEVAGMRSPDVSAADVVALLPPDVADVAEADVTVALEPGEAFELALREDKEDDLEPVLLEAPMTGATPHVGSVPEPLALLMPLDPEDPDKPEEPEEPEEPDDAEPLDPLAGGTQTSVPEDAEEAVDADLLRPPGDAEEALGPEALGPEAPALSEAADTEDAPGAVDADPLGVLRGGGEAFVTEPLAVLDRDPGLTAVDDPEGAIVPDPLKPLEEAGEPLPPEILAVPELPETELLIDVRELEPLGALGRDVAVVKAEPLKPLEEESEIPDAEGADKVAEAEPLKPLSEDEEPPDMDGADERLEPELLETLKLPDDDPELLELERLGEAVTTSVPPTKTSKAESIDTALLSIVIGTAPGTSVVLSMTILVGFTVKVSLPMTMVSTGCSAAWALLLPTRSSSKRKISDTTKECW